MSQGEIRPGTIGHDRSDDHANRERATATTAETRRNTDNLFMKIHLPVRAFDTSYHCLDGGPRTSTPRARKLTNRHESRRCTPHNQAPARP